LHRTRPAGAAVLEGKLFRGELPRPGAAPLIQSSDRTATRLMAQINKFAVISSPSPLAPNAAGQAGATMVSGVVSGFCDGLRGDVKRDGQRANFRKSVNMYAVPCSHSAPTIGKNIAKYLAKMEDKSARYS
jgi:hypothetical protein